MSYESLEFETILVLNFGQLGDVILSLPALGAIRERFPSSAITIMCGKAAAEIVELSGFGDDLIVVDRVRLRNGPKVRSIREIISIVRNVRKRKFDFVIDLHSLSETNLLGYFSGAGTRLFGNRESRSLDYLSNFRPKPPKEDKTKHQRDKYLEILKPLGIENPQRFFTITPPANEFVEMREALSDAGLLGKKSVGIFLGAGHPRRRWKLDHFVGLAEKLVAFGDLRITVFLGPEEVNLADEVKAKFAPAVEILDNLSLKQLFAALSLTDVLVTNDTGPMHLGAVAGAAIVLILDESAPSTFLPSTAKLKIIGGKKINEIAEDEVFEATKEMIANE